MEIQYMSDLHLETGCAPVEPSDLIGDVLVLAGDIHIRPEKLADWLVAINTRVIPVLYVLGNHEYYHRDFDQAEASYRQALQHLPWVHLLERQAIEIEGVRFLGTTLWSDLAQGAHEQACVQHMSDYRVIRHGAGRLQPAATVKAHAQSVDWLSVQLADAGPGPRVVITHHAPSWRSNHPRFVNSDISGGFCSDLEGLIQQRHPNLWIHGHTHDPWDYHVGDCRVVCNARGYPGHVREGERWLETSENPQWQARKIVTI